jgi:hypothetical protein
MTEPESPLAPDESADSAERVRLNKIIKALMDRAERNTSSQGSDFSIFQTTIMLEEQVRRRTAELEAALRNVWSFAVRCGPFLEGVLMLADDKAPALALMADVPALRAQVVAALSSGLPTPTPCSRCLHDRHGSVCYQCAIPAVNGPCGSDAALGGGPHGLPTPTPGDPLVLVHEEDEDGVPNSRYVRASTIHPTPGDPK